jgi:hypothetical protein
MPKKTQLPTEERFACVVPRYNGDHCYEKVPTDYTDRRRIVSSESGDVKPAGIGHPGTDSTVAAESAAGSWQCRSVHFHVADWNAIGRINE